MSHIWRPSLQQLRVASFLIGTAMSVPGDAKVPQGLGAPHETGFEALASAHVVASGFSDVSGLAAEPAGALLVADRVAGTLIRMSADGVAEVVLRDLHAPVGVATTDDGSVFILEAGAGRLLQLLPGGSTVVAAGDLRQPSALAVGPDGRVWIAVHGRGGDEVRSLEPSGGLVTVMSGMPAVRALAVTESALLIATPTSVERVRLHPDGSVGSVTPIVRRWHARGIVADRFGNAYISGWPVGAGGAARAGILKYEESSGRTTRFATGLRGPGAVALEPSGHLLAADAWPDGRLWRFMAPSAPITSLPGFTNQPSVAVAGTADRASLVEVFADGAVQAVTTADERTGRFETRAALAPNSATTVLVVATGAEGAGLASPPARSVVVHDDRPPAVTLTSPAVAAYVRDATTLAASGTDEGSGMASLRFLLDDAEVGGAHAAGGELHLAAQAVADVGRIAEGMHTLTAIAADRAGNHASAAQLLVIDRTPPHVSLVQHPARHIAERSAMFTFGGIDLLSPVIEYSWRLDLEAWSPYQAGTSETFEQLAVGGHTFEVRARDLAGNEDATPAKWEFQVGAVRLEVAEPQPGTVVTTPTVWVRGEAGGVSPLRVSVPLPAELRLLTDAVTAPVVGGRFAFEVPVLNGQKNIVVTATDGTGAVALHAVDLLVQEAAGPRTGIPAVPAAGIVPLTVSFGVASLTSGMYTIDLESDGTVDYSGERPDERQFMYGAAGAFLATIAVTTADGLSQQRRAAVTAYDRPALELALRTVWNGLKDALRQGDAGQAAAFVHTARRQVWRDYFEQLGAALAEVDAIFTDIDIVGVEGDRVECEMMRAVDGLMFSFPVSFALDADGRWRLWQF